MSSPSVPPPSYPAPRPTGRKAARIDPASRRFAVRLALACLATLLLVPDLAPGAELCESAVEGAAGKILSCRLQAESKHSRSPDPARRDAALLKCDASFQSVFRSAVQRYGATSCTQVPLGEMQSHLGRVARELEVASRREGLLPNGDANLQACLVELGEGTGDIDATP
ncbi:MAG: hypothetical protein ACKO2K_03035, partial [Alphaproteobacteria bacterium]